MAINIKWGIYTSAAAFILAFLISIIIGQASFAIAILRALCFAALFFALATGAWILINSFMPELLFPEGNDAANNIFGTEPQGSQGSESSDYGSHINITLGDGASLGDAADAALPDNDGTDVDNVGNIADLVSEAPEKPVGLDEFSGNSYNNSAGDSAASFAEPLSAADGGGGDGGLPMNFDSFAMGGAIAGLEPFGDSFSLPHDAGGIIKDDDDVFIPERKVAGNKPVELEGDFNPKDIALGIRTVLENDKKG